MSYDTWNQYNIHPFNDIECAWEVLEKNARQWKDIEITLMWEYHAEELDYWFTFYC